MNIEEEIHFNAVRNAILDGDLVPFLGAGANLCGRPSGQAWSLGRFLPSGAELSEQIAQRYNYKYGDCRDLLRVAQFVATVQGTLPLFKDLHRCFDADYPPTEVHRFFAELPRILRSGGHPCSPMLIVTTNYDDVMERAFYEADEPFDVVTFVCEGKSAGRFVHDIFGGERRLIESPNEYRGELLQERPVILKLHGTVRRDLPIDPPAGPGRTPSEDESFVITEDHYIDYLARVGVNELIPADLLGKLSTSSILFLGYSLADWNLRIILKRIWLDRRLSANCWAVNAYAEFLEQKIWNARGVDILRMQLDEYFRDLRSVVAAHPPSRAPSATPSAND